MSNNNKINLILGATSLVQPLTGIGQYTLHLAHELAKNPRLSIDYFNGLAWTKTPEVSDLFDSSRIKGFIRKFIPNSYELRRYAQQKAFNLGNNRIKADVYHEPNFLPLEFDGSTVITVHDLSYLRHPEAHPYARVMEMNKHLPKAIEKSSCIITDSNFTKSEIVSEFNIDDKKIFVTHLGKSSDFYPRSKDESHAVLKKFNLSQGKYLLSVGTLEPRKNLSQVISAYRLLPSELARRFPLVIAGVNGWKATGIVAELKSLLKENKALLIGYVSANDLPYLYSAARAFVFPSLYEGFGLPPLEAMASGTPVITSNTSSLPEVVGDAGLMVSIGDVDTLRSHIEMICEDDALHLKLSNAGVEQAVKFSWGECARQTFDAYLFALEGKYF